ncbi:MAG TPA: AAA family ATPase [Motilibacteraceae bacterium]|nr:AAA family ATPase [Motilibacteraceae bacterium]
MSGPVVGGQGVARALLATARPEVSSALAPVLEEAGAFELVGTVPTSNAVSPALRREQVDVLVLDAQIGPMLALDLVREVVARHPFVAVVLLLDAEDLGQVRGAFAAGARAVVHQGLGYAETAARLREAAEWARALRTAVDAERAGDETVGGVLVALAGAKGGVGTSTLTVRLALDAVAAGRRVCLVDLDLQCGDVGQILAIAHHRDLTDLVGVVDDTGTAVDDALFSRADGLRVLLAPPDGERAEEVDAATARSVLGRLKARFDVVVVDCGSVLTEAAAVAVALADEVVVVTTPDVVALRGVRRATQLWERLELRREADVRVLLNRASRASEVQVDTAGRVVGLPLLPVVVPAAFRRLEAAVNAGDPALVEDRRWRERVSELGRSLGTLGPAPQGRRLRRGRRGPTSERPGVEPAGHSDLAVVGAGGGAARAGRTGRAGRARPGGGAGADRGSSSIELLGLTPVLTGLVAALLAAALTGWTLLLAGSAAQRAARAVTVGADEDQARRAALAVLPGAWGDGAQVTVVDPTRADDPAAPNDAGSNDAGSNDAGSNDLAAVDPALRPVWGEVLVSVPVPVLLSWGGPHLPWTVHTRANWQVG